MSQKKIISITTVLLWLIGIPAFALSYNMISADDLKIRIDSKEPTILLDIQKKNAYKEHHFYGSIRTYAYPAKSDADLESAVQGVRMFEQTGNDVVVVGPRGGRASQRTVEYLITRGVPEEKIFILEGGIRSWPYKNMLLDIKGGCK